MGKEKRPVLSLGSVDDLFSTQEMRDEEKLAKIREIPVDEIDPFPKHPYKVRNDEDMKALMESIAMNGVLTPATVRKKESGKYEMISGHRRLKACKNLNMPTIRCEVVDMDKDEATIYMVEANLQRTTILPSEKAFAYKMRLEAMKRKAGRPAKENSSPMATNYVRGRADVELGEAVGESKDTVRRYIRLTELIPEMLRLVDDGTVALRPAVEISYLPRDLQMELLDCMNMEDCTPSHAQTLRMRRLLEEEKLTPESICAIMQEEKPNQKEKIILRDDRVKALLPDNMPAAKREDYIIKALEHYRSYREKQRKSKDMER